MNSLYLLASALSSLAIAESGRLEAANSPTSELAQVLQEEVALARASIDGIFQCVLRDPVPMFLERKDSGICSDGTPLRRNVVMQDGDRLLNVVVLRSGEGCQKRDLVVRRQNPLHPFENTYFKDVLGDGVPEDYFEGSVASGAPLISRSVGGRQSGIEDDIRIFRQYSALLKQVEGRCRVAPVQDDSH